MNNAPGTAKYQEDIIMYMRYPPETAEIVTTIQKRKNNNLYVDFSFDAVLSKRSLSMPNNL